MKNMILLFILSAAWSQQSLPELRIDVRPRLINSDLISVVVQIDNNTQRSISELEGFIKETDPLLKLTKEYRLTIIESYEPSLPAGSSISERKSFKYTPTNQKSYTFHISRIVFIGDHRVYTYHPAVGFIRID